MIIIYDLSPLNVNLPYGINKIKAERDGKTVEKKINVLQDTKGTIINLTFEIENKTITVKGISFKMIYVERGTFWMGAQSSNPNGQNYDLEAESDKDPVHQVTLSSII